MNRSLLMIKPDAYKRGLEPSILERITGAGLRIVHSERRKLRCEEVEELYGEHRGKPFFKINRDFILSGPVGIFVVGGNGNVVKRLRELVGNKRPELAERGTIRGDYGINRERIEENLVHASEDSASAKREVEIFLGSG